jgi:TetR/AcrR family transcriptional regulator, regulator of autoinduction and epiphytic fitness
MQVGRTERSRQLILNAADAVFREMEIASATVEDIAQRAGLTRKTVYNLFASKEDIALQLIARVEANDSFYRTLIAENTNVIILLEKVLLDSAGWCLANPSLARLALAPLKRPTLEPPTDRPSFQGLCRDILRLGQDQGVIRRDDDANFMSLILLGIYGQAMLTALSGSAFSENDVRHILRVVFEGIGTQP